MKSDWNGRLKHWALAISEGKGQQVRKELESVKLRLLPRPKVTEFSAICRRADRADIGLKLLGPFVKASRRDPTAASEAELAEYAASLVRIGAGEEAVAILKKIDPKHVPEALLYLSFALASCWEYGAMIPVLTTYLGLPDQDPYQRAIARVNLAAAYTWQEPGPGVNKMLEPLIEEAKANLWQLLHGNALELLAQNAVARGEWKEAETRLGQARKLLRHSGVRDVFFARKWKVFARLQRFGWSPKIGKAMVGLRALAREKGHWETLRQCDLFEAISRKDKSLLERLYYGTPFPAFQSKVLLHWHHSIPKHYEWVLRDGKSATTLDLTRGEIERKEILKPGRTPHRVLSLLARDFFRPLRMASLALNLYPDEVYNPQTSPQRVHSALSELRKILKEEEVPLEIVSDDAGFRLEATAPMTILLSRGKKVDRWEDPLFDRLYGAFSKREFSPKEARRYLGGSTRTVLRILSKGVEQGLLNRSGKAAVTRYQFSKDPSKK